VDIEHIGLIGLCCDNQNQQICFKDILEPLKGRGAKIWEVGIGRLGEHRRMYPPGIT